MNAKQLTQLKRISKHTFSAPRAIALQERQKLPQFEQAQVKGIPMEGRTPTEDITHD